jgi:hypothetical protein
MPEPGDALFLALAQAKAQPDRWARAVNTGAEAGQNIVGGYMQGKQIQQQLQDYKIQNTPLGELFPDPSTIPYGLGPQHTVRDLHMVASSLENWAPPGVISSTAQNYGQNVAQPMGARASAPPQPTQAPAPTIASTSMAPIPGSENPAPPPGTANLGAIQGAGAGAQPNIPAGTSPTITVPPGGMGMNVLKNIAIPSWNAAREGRQFQAGQAQAAQIAQLSRDQTERNFQQSQAQGRHIAGAGVVEKNAPNLTAVGQLETAMTAMDKLNSDPANVSIPFSGQAGAWYAKHVPSTKSTWALNQKAAQGWAGVGAGAIEKLVEGRYNDDQMQRIQDALFPVGNELGTPSGNLKMQQLKAYVEKAKSGGIAQVMSSLDSIAGGVPNITSLTNPGANTLTPSQLGNSSQPTNGPATGSDLGGGVKVRRVIKRVS